jgi:hypothetical protein
MSAETKEQPKQWMHTHSPNKPNKLKQILSARKLMASVFLDEKGILVVEFTQKETKVTSKVCCETTKTA